MTHVQWFGEKLKRLNSGQDVKCKYVGMLQQGSSYWSKYEWKGVGGEKGGTNHTTTTVKP
jgi:hypothetical protein